MEIQINVNGIREASSFFLSLSRNSKRELMEASFEFAKFVQKSAKLRAPRNTGQLAKTIRVYKDKDQVIVDVEDPVAIFQEKGFTPHWVHTSMSDRRGNTIGKSLGIRGNRFIFVKRFKPFLAPALEAGLNRLPYMLNKGMEKAIIKSGGKNV